MKTSKTHSKRALFILLVCLMGMAKAMAQSFTVGNHISNGLITQPNGIQNTRNGHSTATINVDSFGIRSENLFYDQVVAEYYPDPNDPDSPYVKVSWNAPDNNFTYHYSVYRTDCDNNNPSSFLASDLSETVFIDTTWSNASRGTYKYGVICLPDTIQRNIPLGEFTELHNSNTITSGTLSSQRVENGSTNTNTQLTREEGWIYYDDGTYATNIGTGGGRIYWASMFPSSLLTPYTGTTLTKIALYENSLNTDPVTVSICLGGTDAPGTVISMMDYIPVGGDAFHEVTLFTPVFIDGTQNLWIVFSEYGTHPAAACPDTGVANNRWVSLNGIEWMDVATAGLPGYGWMIRGYLQEEYEEPILLLSNCLENPGYRYYITAAANPIEGGSVNGTGYFYENYYHEGDICTLTATANDNYHFVNWKKNGEVVSTEPIYSFIVSEDAEYIADFECNVLGDFTYMSPTNNYPVSTFPIVFTWDAVANAQHYDLYLWNVNDSEPDEPFVSGLTNSHYTCASLPNHQTYQWYVRAYNSCNERISSIKNFNLDVNPAIYVSTSNINFGEIAINHSETRTLNVSGIVLEDSMNIEIVGDDASMFSFATASNWNELTGGQLTVTFHPTVAQWDYHSTLIISSGSLTQSVTLLGSIADYYVFHTYADNDVYAMNSTIPIHGSVMDNESTPMANVEVEIGIFVMGMKRTLQATTDENGEFAADFEPIQYESGYYTINSGHVGNHSTAVHDEFNIPGMSVVTNGYILCAVTQNQPKTDSIQLRNKCNLELNDIQVSVLSAPEGCSINFMPLSLGGMETNDLIYTINGTELTQGNQYQEIKLRVSSNEGATTDFSIWYYCMEPRGILNVAPNNINTTMTKGKSKIMDVMLSNHGTAASGEITIELPEVEWMSVVGSSTLPSLTVNDSAYFSLRLAPGNDIPLTQYSGNIAINCEHGEYVNLPFTITAVSDSTGNLVVDVTDEYTWNTNGGFGPHLANAEVTLKGYYSLETVAQGYTNDNGIFNVEQLPEGYYRLHVEADHHEEYNNVILIEAGITNQQDIFLSYQAVTYDWTVVPGEIQDEYEFILNTTYETNVPFPVVTIDAPTSIPDFEESYTFNYLITNHGLINTYNIKLHVPLDEDYLFTPLYEIFDTLSALTTIEIPCTVTRLTNNTHICKHWVESWVEYQYDCGPYFVAKYAHDYTMLGTESCGITPPSGGGIGGGIAGGGGGAPGFGGWWGGGTGHPSLYIYNIPVITPSGSICVQVGVQFNQQLVMTREAFFGTFSVHNGFDTESLESIGLNFTVKDEDGNDCTHLFQITTTSLEGLTGIDGDGSLGGGMQGMAKILFIPTKEAAPTEPKIYRFGGTFTFFDPYASNTIVCDLYPVPLTVHPSPDLHVDYFMQRDIIGDDALTEGVVEPSVPAELGVIINNKGAGTAKNVILETAEPKIVDNAQGLAINFAMYGASFNGNEAQLGLMEIPFGDIESGRTAVGEWLFTSSLLGHFVSYEAHVIHNNSYGNPDLSLVSHLDIHELIHPIRAYGNLDDGINDFLVNDVPDQHSYPDSIYFSNGGRTGVSLVNNISFDHYVTPQDTIVTLTVRPSKTGWNYGVVDDPGSEYVLVGCKRNTDNQVILLNNIWQTFVTLRDGEEPIYENKLHFVDTLSNGRQDYTYTLIYSQHETVSPYQINIEDEICEGEDYNLNGFNLTDLSVGTYDETLYIENVYGCDNIISLHLMVYESPEVHIQIDTINQNGISFRLTAIGADNYEWSTGETTASIIVSPINPTTFSVVGTNSNGCSDSDEVIVSGGTGINENQTTASAIIFPNPAHDKLFIKTMSPVNAVEIFSITGTLVHKQSSNSDTIEIDVQHISSGMYFIRLIANHSVETMRFVKE